MRPVFRSSAILFLAASALAAPQQAAALEPPPATLWHAPDDAEIDGVALPRDGGTLVGLRHVERGQIRTFVLRIDAGGSATVFARLPAAPLCPWTSAGGIALAAARDGAVLVTHPTFDPGTHGVYRISSSGLVARRLPGSERIVLPNGVALDDRGDVYVTDGIAGAVFRGAADAGRPLAPWIRHATLQPAPGLAPSAALAGAHGIAFRAPDALVVANSSTGTLLEIGLDGAAAPRVVAAGRSLLTAGGLAIDAAGDVLAAVRGAGVLGAAPLVRIDATTGAVRPVDIASQLDAPRGLALDRGGRALVVDGSPLVPGRRTSPGLLRIDVGSPLAQGNTGSGAAAAKATFRDGAADRILSDGQGSYSASLDPLQAFEMNTNARELRFDFTQRTSCGETFIPCVSPFASTNDVGSAPRVTLSAWRLASLDPIRVTFDFEAGGERWNLYAAVSMQQVDTDNDQVIDRYVLTPASPNAQLALMRFEKLQSTGGRGRDPRHYWIPYWAGDYAMDWQVVVDVK